MDNSQFSSAFDIGRAWATLFLQSRESIIVYYFPVRPFAFFVIILLLEICVYILLGK